MATRRPKYIVKSTLEERKKEIRAHLRKHREVKIPPEATMSRALFNHFVNLVDRIFPCSACGTKPEAYRAPCDTPRHAHLCIECWMKSPYFAHYVRVELPN